MNTLMDSVSGRYRLRTASSSEYLVDLDRMTLTRHPIDTEVAQEVAAALRRDRSAVSLLRILACTVGRPAKFLIDLEVGEGIVTFRSTTEIISIDLEPTSHHDA